MKKMYDSPSFNKTSFMTDDIVSITLNTSQVLSPAEGRNTAGTFKNFKLNLNS